MIISLAIEYWCFLFMQAIYHRQYASSIKILIQLHLSCWTNKKNCDMTLCSWYKDSLKSLLNFNILMCWVMLILLRNNISDISRSAFYFCEIADPASLSMADKDSFACCSVGHSEGETLTDNFEFPFLQFLVCYGYNCFIFLLLHPVILPKIFVQNRAERTHLQPVDLVRRCAKQMYVHYCPASLWLASQRQDKMSKEWSAAFCLN